MHSQFQGVCNQCLKYPCQAFQVSESQSQTSLIKSKYSKFEMKYQAINSHLLSIICKLHNYVVLWHSKVVVLYFFFFKTKCQTLQNLLSQRPFAQNQEYQNSMGSTRYITYLYDINFSLERATGNSKY